MKIYRIRTDKETGEVAAFSGDNPDRIKVGFDKDNVTVELIQELIQERRANSQTSLYIEAIVDIQQ